jgi:hypothetical protein
MASKSIIGAAATPPPTPSPSVGGGDAGRPGYPRKIRKNPMLFRFPRSFLTGVEMGLR